MQPNLGIFSSILSALWMILLLGCSGPITRTGIGPIMTYTPMSGVPSGQADRLETIEPLSTLNSVSTPKSLPTAVSTFRPQPSGTPTVTWTPIATLPATQAVEKLLEIYANNGGCQLPCWWGITPGKTKATEMLSMLMPLGRTWISEMDHGITRYAFEFSLPQSIDPFGNFGPGILVENGVVVAIVINTNYTTPEFDYSLAGILKELGQPEEIWLDVFDEPGQGPPPYEISLYYPSRGFEVSISEYATLEEDSLRLCPQDIFSSSFFPPGMSLWSPTEKFQFKDIKESVIGPFAANIDIPSFRLLEDLTEEIDTRSFYEIYRDPKTNHCFAIPLAKFPLYLTKSP